MNAPSIADPTTVIQQPPVERSSTRPLAHDEAMSTSEIEHIARTIAIAAHEGQVDKAGRPYIEHPARVVARLTSSEARAAAWLHDTVEDTEVTAEDLAAAGLPDSVVDAVVALSRLPGEDRDDYYQRVRADPLALEVKLADVADNSDPARLALLDAQTAARLTARYAHTLEVLRS